MSRCPNCKHKMPVRYTTAHEAVVANASEKLTVAEIAKAAGVKLITARTIISEHGLPHKAKRPAHPDGTAAERLSAAATGNKTVAELARECGVSLQWAYMLVRKHTISVRDGRAV